jgi:hypothetical protein
VCLDHGQYHMPLWEFLWFATVSNLCHVLTLAGYII